MDKHKHNVIGQGAFGCIHKEPLQCGNKINKIPNSISKVSMDVIAEEEMLSNEDIDLIDSDYEFHVKDTFLCDVKNDLENKEAIGRCRLSNSIDPVNITNNKLIIMRHAGENLAEYSLTITKRPENEVNCKKFESLWIAVRTLLQGLKRFNDFGYIHHDVKPQNIMYLESSNRFNYIDFGMFQPIKKYKDKAIMSKNDYGLRWWSYPPEYVYINRDAFDELDSIDGIRTSFISELDNFKNGTSYDKTKLEFLTQLLPYIKTWSLQYIDDCQNVYTYDLEDYDELIDCTYKTFDVYGLGFSLLHLLESGKHLLNPDFFKDMGDLLYQAITPEYVNRIQIEEWIESYDTVLENHGLLHEFDATWKDVKDVKKKGGRNRKSTGTKKRSRKLRKISRRKKQKQRKPQSTRRK